MDKIKFKVLIKKSRDVISLASFIDIANKTLDFLNNVTIDMGHQINREQWIATGFKSSQPEYQLETEVEEGIVGKFNEEISKNITANLDDEEFKECNINTIKSYFDIAAPLQLNDEIDFGIYQNGDDRPTRWFDLKKENAILISERIEKMIQKEPTIQRYYGNIEGIIYVWHKEGYKPYLEVKDEKSNNSIKCYYNNDMYNYIYPVFANRKSKVSISGMITEDRYKRQILSIEVKKILILDYALYYKEGDLDKFIGCLSGLLGELTPREYIDKVRGEDE